MISKVIGLMKKENVITMKVNELIEKLQQLPQDKEVVILFESGDYWNSMISEQLEVVEVKDLKYSDYHQTYKLPKAKYRDEGDEELEEFVVLGNYSTSVDF